MHLVLNLAVVSLYVVNLWLRTTRAPEATEPIVLSAIGLVLLVSAGWLGGEMVYVHGGGRDRAGDRHQHGSAIPAAERLTRAAPAASATRRATESASAPSIQGKPP